MTTKSEFDAEEWDRVQRAPALAALTVMLTERGGAIREGIAFGEVYAEARRGAGSELIEELVSSPPRLETESIGPPDELRAELPDRIREGIAVVDRKATAQEAQQYRDFILRVADVVAHAAKELSEEERAVLDELLGVVDSR